MGIFDHEANIFTTYRARIQFRDKIMGGTPKDPRLIEGWIRAKAGVSDVEELRQMMIRTLVELGADVTPDMSYEQLEAASQSLALVRNTVGFKQDANGLYLESRTVKAMLKEVTNVLFAGDRWGKTQKGPRSFLAERVFISPDKLYLGTVDPSGVDMFIGHTSGPKGLQSNLTYYEYVMQPSIEFEVMVTKDAIEHDHWPMIWVQAQENGLGALRSQGHGRFDIEEWEVARAALRRVA